MPENFLEINRYFALTSYCNTIGQSNNAFSILGFALAGKRRVHVLIFVTRDNNRLRTTIYRKPTHTDRLLDQSSYDPISHKSTAIRTLTSLTRRAQLVCDSPYSLQDETDYPNNVLLKATTTQTLLNTHSR